MVFMEFMEFVDLYSVSIELHRMFIEFFLMESLVH